MISNGLFYLAHMDPVPAKSIAWAAAVLFAFVTNKWWVFGSHDSRHSFFCPLIFMGKDHQLAEHVV